jgi:methyl-accepting chemotaxis protein
LQQAGEEALNALQQAQVSGRFQLTYFGEGSGKMNDSDPSINRDGYDPRSRGWYQEAMAKGGMIDQTLPDVAYKVMVVTRPSRPRRGRRHLSIASLVDDITKMKLPADGFAILMHKDGTVIAYKAGRQGDEAGQRDRQRSDHALIEQSKASNSLVPAFF